MITESKFNHNKNSFYASASVYNVCPVDFIDKLADMGLFDAPASTMVSLHNAFKGGLVDHLLRVAKYAVKINEMLPGEDSGSNMRQTKESVVKVSLLHGIGKVGLYKPCTSDWHIKNQGKMYEFNEDLTSMSVGERSIYYIMTHNEANILNDFEFQAILNYDKPQTDKASEWHTSILGEILRMAVKLAITEEKYNSK